MAAPGTTQDLLTILDKSRLLESVDIHGYLRRHPHSAAALARPQGLADVLVGDGLLTRFQADNLLQGKWMRFFIGPYKVLEALGAGNSGVVYLCEHGCMRRRVAVKVLQGDKARDPKSLERFHREARAAAALDHPNIVRAFDVGKEDRFHYLVMEFVDGQNLRELVKNDGPLTATRAADYLRQAALGLAHAHEAGLVHRDIKPSNLMLDREGAVKILDLGLARFFEDQSEVLTIGAVLGSADYMAPEQSIDSHAVDIRADIYSLGATFWFAVTGHRPARDGLEFLRRPGTPSTGAVARMDVPEGMWRVLRTMMARRPEDRYQTAGEVVEAILPWAPDEAARLLLVESPPESQPAVEDTAVHAAAETVTEQVAVAVSPAPAVAAAPKETKANKRGTRRQGKARRFRRPLLFLAVTVALALVAGFVASRSQRRTVVPGREPGAIPYFRPLTPHSP